jgi:hypothetical protein
MPHIGHTIPVQPASGQDQDGARGVFSNGNVPGIGWIHRMSKAEILSELAIYLRLRERPEVRGLPARRFPYVRQEHDYSVRFYDTSPVGPWKTLRAESGQKYYVQKVLNNHPATDTEPNSFQQEDSSQKQAD